MASEVSSEHEDAPLIQDAASPMRFTQPSLFGELSADDDDVAVLGGAPGSPDRLLEEMGLLDDSDDDRNHGGERGQLNKVVIWGTTVSMENCKKRFSDFVHLYDEDLLDQIAFTGEHTYALDCTRLYHFDDELYKDLIQYPQEVTTIFDMTLETLFQEKFPDMELEEQIKVRPYRLINSKPMRDLNPSDIGSLISLNGMVTRCSSVIPDLKQGFFKCDVCQEEARVDIDRGYLEEPTQCPNCQKRGSMRLVYNRCVFADRQIVKLQETPDAIPEGETPQTVTLNVYEDLVDEARPGDRSTVTGIFRASTVRLNSVHKTIKSIYRTYVDALHFERKETGRPDDDRLVGTDQGKMNWPEEKIAEFKELAALPDIYDRLTRSVAPGIWELDDVKKGILCMLFGGVPKILRDTKARGDVNVLMCGDPGTSKSQLLQYVHKLAPRGLYTSGKGSSAVGLTAYVTKDADTGQAVLESGALVLSDRGILCLDEMDKMNDMTRSVLHEAMEQQTISIAKAGIICTLNARTSIFACANPVESRYNPRMSVVDNLQLPPTLLSRFDLIYLILDKPSKQTDTRLAKHIVQMYYENVPPQLEVIPPGDLREFIMYCRSECHPIIEDDVAEQLVEAYVRMRRLGGNRKTITATPRQLESLIRLAEALAKMRLSPTVDAADVTEAARLIKVALQQAAIDPHTGCLDMDLISTGRSAAARSRLADLAKAIRDLINAQVAASFTFDDLYTKMREQSDVDIPQTEFRDAMRSLEEEDFIRRSGSGRRAVYTKL